MIEIIPIKEKLKASIRVPGSKSITNRAFLLAALAQGTSTLSNCLESDDTKYMQAALQNLGINIEKIDDKFVIEGKGGKLSSYSKEIFLGNAGTATRFLTAACSIGQLPYTVTGNEHMQTRPIQPLTEALEQASLTLSTNNGCPPVQITGGQFKGGEIKIDGTVSSQYISALLMIGPFGQKDLVLEIENELTSKPYVDITIDVMSAFGVEVENHNYQKFIVRKGQKYQAQNYTVESDFSSASYFGAIAAFTNSQIKLENLSFNSKQGDKEFLKVLEEMGCQVTEQDNNILVEGPQELKALGSIDLNHIPDTALTVAILAAYAKGETEITNIYNLRVKETDRINALENELKKLGIKVSSTESSIKIIGDPDSLKNKFKGTEIDTYDDHRIAMCFGSLGAVLPKLKIKNPICVQKSYPEFWEDLKSIGIKLNQP